METRWKNVRDGLTKWLRTTKTKSGDGAKNVKPYKYARILEFLMPFLANRETVSNLPDSEEDISDNDSTREDEEFENTAESGPTFGDKAEIASIASSATSKKAATKGQKRSLDYVDQTLCDYLKKKTSTTVTSEEPDEIDLFLKSMASTIRKLPARKRADVRFQIHNIVHQAEMECLYPPTPPPTRLPTTSYYGNEEASNIIFNQDTGQRFTQL